MASPASTSTAPSSQKNRPGSALMRPDGTRMNDFTKMTKKELRRFIKTWEPGWRDAQAEYVRRYGKPYNG